MAAVLLILSGSPAWAQFESASVLGYVHDASGAAVTNSTVTLTNTATGISQTKTTDSEGKYEFPSVQIGNYQIVAEASGFDRTRTETFTVLTNARQRVDVISEDRLGLRRGDGDLGGAAAGYGDELALDRDRNASG